MKLAGPGDIVELEDGIYEDALESVTDGEEDNPITVIGGWGAIIKSISSPSVLITHSHIHLVVCLLLPVGQIICIMKHLPVSLSIGGMEFSPTTPRKYARFTPLFLHELKIDHKFALHTFSRPR